jgi:hypothetical protein
VFSQTMYIDRLDKYTLQLEILQIVCRDVVELLVESHEKLSRVILNDC